MPSDRIEFHVRTRLIQSLEHHRRPDTRILLAYVRPMNEKHIRLFCEGGMRQNDYRNRQYDSSNATNRRYQISISNVFHDICYGL